MQKNKIIIGIIVLFSVFIYLGYSNILLVGAVDSACVCTDGCAVIPNETTTEIITTSTHLSLSSIPTTATEISTITTWGVGVRVPITYKIDLKILGNSYNKALKEEDIVNFNISANEPHSLTIKSVHKKSLIIILESTPIEATMDVGDTKKFDLNNDGVYDISIKLNGILSGGFANILITRIEEKSSEQITTEPVSKIITTMPEKVVESSKSPVLIGIIIVLVIVFVIIIIYFGNRFIKNKNKKK